MNLNTSAVEYNVRLGSNMHAPGDGGEIIAMERVALEDEGVQAAIAKLQLPEGSQVVIDPWIYGRSKGFYRSNRLQHANRTCRF